MSFCHSLVSLHHEKNLALVKLHSVTHWNVVPYNIYIHSLTDQFIDGDRREVWGALEARHLRKDVGPEECGEHVDAGRNRTEKR